MNKYEFGQLMTLLNMIAKGEQAQINLVAALLCISDEIIDLKGQNGQKDEAIDG
jgi:hypothetical protein